MSALRVSPPSESVHDGKEVGTDIVEYVYKQVRPPSYYHYFPLLRYLPQARGNPLVYHCDRLWKRGISTIPTGGRETLHYWCVDRARGNGSELLGI